MGHSAHPQAAGAAAAAAAAAAFRRCRCAGLQSRCGRAPARGWYQDRALRLPVDLGLARRAGGENPPRGRPCAVHLPVRARAAGAAWHCRDLCRASTGQRDTAGAGQGRGARPPGPAGAGRGAGGAAGQPGVGGQLHRAAVLRGGGPAAAPAAGAQGAGAGGAGAEGTHRTAGAGLRRARAGAAARRPVAHRARSLRLHADRQRHRHAGGRAVQAPDGDRLPHAPDQLAADAPQAAAALGGSAQYPMPRFRRARAAAGRGHAAGAGRGAGAVAGCGPAAHCPGGAALSPASFGTAPGHRATGSRCARSVRRRPRIQ